MLSTAIPVTLYGGSGAESAEPGDNLVTGLADGLSLTACWAGTGDFTWAGSSTQSCQDLRIASGVAVHTLGFPDVRLALCTADGRIVATADWPKPRCLAVDASRSHLVAGSENGEVRLFDARTLRLLCTIRLDETTEACAFSHTGGLLAVATARDLHLLSLTRGA